MPNDQGHLRQLGLSGYSGGVSRMVESVLKAKYPKHSTSRTARYPAPITTTVHLPARYHPSGSGVSGSLMLQILFARKEAKERSHCCAYCRGRAARIGYATSTAGVQYKRWSPAPSTSTVPSPLIRASVRRSQAAEHALSMQRLNLDRCTAEIATIGFQLSPESGTVDLPAGCAEVDAALSTSRRPGVAQHSITC